MVVVVGSKARTYIKVVIIIMTEDGWMMMMIHIYIIYIILDLVKCNLLLLTHSKMEADRLLGLEPVVFIHKTAFSFIRTHSKT